MSETKLRLRGFTKVQIVDSDSGTVVGDSGWVQNKITKVGFHNMAVRGAAGVSGAILRFHATWLAASNWISQDSTINGIGIFNNTNAISNANIDANKMLAGTTFAESAWSADQEVRATYELKFSQ